MNYKISIPSKKIIGTVNLTSSKSESNRVLIIQALCHEKFEIENLSTSDDTILLKRMLEQARFVSSNESNYYTGDGGTTTRFLIAYLCTKPGTHIVQTSEQMKQRPIGILVNALQKLGAQIEYLENEGQTPVKIIGNKQLRGGEIMLDGSVSSQFITALMLIASEMQQGLSIKFEGEVVSRPYINMTLKMLQEFRVYGQWQDNAISVSKQNYHIKSDANYVYKVEGDWSSASYWYAMAALAGEVDLNINGLKHPSLQGDSIVADLFTLFGVKTSYTQKGVQLSKIPKLYSHIGFDFNDTPDLVQTIAVTAAALNSEALLNGVSTLSIKETNRIKALESELKKLGAEIQIHNGESISVIKGIERIVSKQINTKGDHRTAMSFACLAVSIPNIVIKDAEVVSKSYPEFWNDMRAIGFELKEI